MRSLSQLQSWSHWHEPIRTRQHAEMEHQAWLHGVPRRSNAKKGVDGWSAAPWVVVRAPYVGGGAGVLARDTTRHTRCRSPPPHLTLTSHPGRSEATRSPAHLVFFPAQRFNEAPRPTVGEATRMRKCNRLSFASQPPCTKCLPGPSRCRQTSRPSLGAVTLSNLHQQHQSRRHHSLRRHHHRLLHGHCKDTSPNRQYSM